MAALQGESAQQRWLHVGDTLLLFLRTRRGYVYSELSGLVAIERAWERFWACLFLQCSSQHNYVTVFPEQLNSDTLDRKESVVAAPSEDADPFFPNITLNTASTEWKLER